MRFMILPKATSDSEAGVLSSEEQLTEMGRYNEEPVNAGALLAADGRRPSCRGARITFAAGGRTWSTVSSRGSHRAIGRVGVANVTSSGRHFAS